MCICRVCRSSSAFSLQTSWTSGPGLVPSLAAVSPGDEGTGRTCQAPAQTGLCSSSLQPRIRRAAGHGPPDRTRAHQGDRDCLGHRAGPADPGGFQLHLHPLVPEGPRPAPA